MAAPIALPRLGWTMEEGTLVEWLKRDGDAVAVGDKLFVMEGDKATEEIEAIDAGILRIPPDSPAVGSVLKVGTVLAYVCAADEPLPWLGKAPGEENIAAAATAASPSPEPVAAPTPTSTSAATAHETEAESAISPRARRVARELGIDWRGVTGTGRTGRIRERDIRAAASASPPSSPRPVTGAALGKPPAGKVLPLSAVRRTVADRMLKAAQTTAPVTLTTRVDATNLVGLRRQFQAAAEVAGEGAFVPSFTELIARLVAGVLPEHPAVNAVWHGEQLVLADEVHLALAVDTESGLVAPVIHDAHRRSLRELALEARQLVERARTGRLAADDLQGGTFSLTSLGMFGVDAFTPILNVPQVAILGVGRIVRAPDVVDEQVTVRDQLWLSLTIDHRAVDGAPAARFLSAVRTALENPGPRLVM